MLLIITNKADYTADFLILELHRRGIGFVRFNTEDFPSEIGMSLEIDSAGNIDGYLLVYGKRTALSQIGSIWYRRPLPPSPIPVSSDPTAQDFITMESRYTLDTLWRILPCFWVSNPDRIRSAEAKAYQLIVAAGLGLTIPQTLITTQPDEAACFYEAHSQAIIYKPQRYVQVNHAEDTHLIYTTVVDEEKVKYLDDVRFVPSLFQNYIPKSSELRVTVLGETVITAQIHSQEHDIARHDWRRANSTDLRHTPYELPADIARKCVALVKSLGLAFGAIDMILTPEGEHVFLEINPNGQWAWIEQTCPELRIREALIELLMREDRDH